MLLQVPQSRNHNIIPLYWSELIDFYMFSSHLYVIFCISYHITIIDQRSVSKKANNWLDSVNIYSRCTFVQHIYIQKSLSSKLLRDFLWGNWLLPVWLSENFPLKFRRVSCVLFIEWGETHVCYICIYINVCKALQNICIYMQFM